MSWLDLIALMGLTASVSCGGVFGLAMARSRIRSLCEERNAALLRASSQADTIDRLLQRQQQRQAAQDISGEGHG